MRTSAYGRLFITNEEGKKNLAYPDPLSPLYQWCQRNGFDPYNIVELTPEMQQYSGAPWTIGVGATGSDVHQGLWWDDTAIDARLTKDLGRWEACLNEHVEVPLSQNEFDALVSFLHNIGETQFLSSTLLRLLNQGDYQGCAGQFERWDMAGGVHNDALLARRKRERDLFLDKDTKTLAY